MDAQHRIQSALAVSILIFVTGAFAQQAEQPERARVRETMLAATKFMVEKASVRGGYVWSYLPDFSRRWGEMEAYPTMIWVQPPGTATMGHLFLDAYHATGDEYYYRAAEQTADALIAGQHKSGGWNYLIDFGGDESLHKWYATIGKNGWRLEEFQYFYGNATFDDGGTAEASKFLLRLFLEKKDDKYKPALDQALAFVLDSQYPCGGWPQRFPMTAEYTGEGKPDYPADITFNDDVAAENIDFLLMYYRTLHDERALAAIKRAMDCFIVLQQPQPQPGWAEQYTLELKPAAARNYEPLGLTTKTTERNIGQLQNFYRLTGEAKFLARIPEALDWLDAIRLPAGLTDERFTHSTYIELGSNKPLFIHRRGSNVVNGEYYHDGNPDNTVSHTASLRTIDVAGLRRRFAELKALPLAEATRNSPLLTSGTLALPRFYANQGLVISDMNIRDEPARGISPRRVAQLLDGLNEAGYWPAPLRAISNPYIGPGPQEVTPGDYSQTRVGDQYDTSPYITNDPPTGISTGVYIRNMSTLIQYLDEIQQRELAQ